MTSERKEEINISCNMISSRLVSMLHFKNNYFHCSNLITSNNLKKDRKNYLNLSSSVLKRQKLTLKLNNFFIDSPRNGYHIRILWERFFFEIDRPLDFNETFVNSSVLNVVSINDTRVLRKSLFKKLLAF